jgi:hypothetical protein
MVTTEILSKIMNKNDQIHVYSLQILYRDSFSQENDKKRKKMLNIISFETSDWSIQHILNFKLKC